ncbi:MAG: ABC transporter permease [Caldilineales bacterium]|nr:ABC transporter permease [Caldilineales bacterium]
MHKIWSVAYKDTLIRFRDRNGILLMLAAPLVLAVIIGAAFGGFGGDDPTLITDIPLIIVNQDAGDLGEGIVDVFASDELSDLLEPLVMDDLVEAKRQVEQGESRAVVFIPADFSDTVRSQQNAATAIELFTDPAATISPIVIRSILTEVVNGYNAGIVGGRVGVMQLLQQGDVPASEMARLPSVLSETLSAQAGQNASQIELETAVIGDPNADDWNPLAYFAPSMAILFLMFTLFDASRSILREEEDGTLQRMISSPTAFSQILAGKNGGVFVTGVLQLGILIGASALFFGVKWGSSPFNVILMIVAVVAAASSLGAFITAFARDATQAAIIGSAIALIFAILGGNFFVAQAYPDWLQPLSRLTINRWALDGFTDLSLRGGGFRDIWLDVAVLLAMSAVLFALAAWRLPRRFVR